MGNVTISQVRRLIFLSSALLLVALGIGTVSALTWHIETVDSEGLVGDVTSLALDSGGAPSIAYSSDSTLKYASYSGSAWQIETADTGGGASLELDNVGNPHISYTSADGSFYPKYSWKDGSGWHSEIVASFPGVWGDLALDVAGNPHISFHKPWVGYDLYYAWRDATGWHNQVVDDYGDVGEQSSLALDADGNPHISSDYCGGMMSNGQVAYYWRNSAGWVWNVVRDWGGGPSERQEDPSLALDSAGNPRIAYRFSGVGYANLKYAWPDGSDWHIETVDSGNRAGFRPSLALDRAGNPHLVYYVNYDDPTNVFIKHHSLKYAWRDGSGWHNETVNMYDSSDPYGGYSFEASLALDSAGTPHISYVDYSTALPVLKYARADQSSQAVVTVAGGSGIPTDTNADGLCDDVNGNGRKDFADVVLYFNQMSWIAANEPAAAFDYNGNGRIDFADVVWLFNNL